MTHSLHTRRAFVSRLAAGSLGLLAAACTSSAPAAPTTGAPPTTGVAAAAQATAPAAASSGAGQRLVVGAGRQVFEGNNEARTMDGFVGSLYEALVGVDPTTGKYAPQLAEKWQVEPNGKDWRFFLRKGVVFHNNMGELTADDVVFTFDQITGPGQTQMNPAGELRNIIDHWEVVNPYELVLVAKKPDAGTTFFVSQAPSALGIMSKKDFDARGGKAPDLSDTDTPPLAGTGPFQYVSRAKNQNFVAQRVAYQHWKVTPEFQELEFRIIPDASTRLAALLHGEIGLTQITRDQRDQALSQGMKLFRGSIPSTGVFLGFMGSYLNDLSNPAAGYKYQDSPVMDVRVRRALSKAVDRSQLNQLFHGDGQPMYLPFHNETEDGALFNAEWKSRFQDEYGFDQDAARQLLSQAGYGQSKPLTMTIEVAGGVGGTPEQADVLEAVGEMWRGVGVQPQLETLDLATFADKARQMDFQSAVYMFALGQPESQILDRLLDGTRVVRGYSFENPEYLDVFGQAIAALDPQKRGQLWRQAGDLDYSLHRSIPLFWLAQEYIGNPKIVAAWDTAANMGPSSMNMWLPYAKVAV